MDNATTTALALDHALAALQSLCAALRYASGSGSVQGIGQMIAAANNHVDQASEILYPLAMNARSQDAAEQAAADAKVKAKLAEEAAAEAQQKAEEAAAAAKAAQGEPAPPVVAGGA